MARSGKQRATRQRRRAERRANEEKERRNDDAILVGTRGTLIARTEEPIEDVTTARRF